MPGDNGSSEAEKKKITRIAVGERFLVLMNKGRVFFCAFGTTINYVKVMRQLVASRKVRRVIPVQGG